MKQIKIFSDGNYNVLKIETEINDWIKQNKRQGFTIDEKFMCVYNGKVIISIWYTD